MTKPGNPTAAREVGPTPPRTPRRVYLDEVRGEIDDEVRRRRMSGDLPPNIERELDQLFLAHSPLGGRAAALRDMLRLVDASVFIDPVVPVESRRPGGTTVKRGLRSLSLWYLRYVTHQVSEFATAVSRALHVLDVQVTELRHKVETMAAPPSLAIRVAWAHNVAAWWVPAVIGELADHEGRSCTLRVETGGWSARSVARQVDAYGVDPRPARWGPDSVPWTCGPRTSWRMSGPWPRAHCMPSCCPVSSRDRAIVERRRLLEGAVRRLSPEGCCSSTP